MRQFHFEDVPYFVLLDSWADSLKHLRDLKHSGATAFLQIPGPPGITEGARCFPKEGSYIPKAATL